MSATVVRYSIFVFLIYFLFLKILLLLFFNAVCTLCFMNITIFIFSFFLNIYIMYICILIIILHGSKINLFEFQLLLRSYSQILVAVAAKDIGAEAIRPGAVAALAGGLKLTIPLAPAAAWPAAAPAAKIAQVTRLLRHHSVAHIVSEIQELVSNIVPMIIALRFVFFF